MCGNYSEGEDRHMQNQLLKRDQQPPLIIYPIEAFNSLPMPDTSCAICNECIQRHDVTLFEEENLINLQTNRFVHTCFHPYFRSEL